MLQPDLGAVAADRWLEPPQVNPICLDPACWHCRLEVEDAGSRVQSELGQDQLLRELTPSRAPCGPMAEVELQASAFASKHILAWTFNFTRSAAMHSPMKSTTKLQEPGQGQSGHLPGASRSLHPQS